MSSATTEKKTDSFNATLVECMSHLRDCSVRDGIQSWDANKWRIADILPVVAELNNLAREIKTAGGKLPPVEVWGGGQVAQPAKFLGEDPLVNLTDIRKTAPDLELQCLSRGRQGFGFAPISSEVQEAAIAAAADRGITVFRIFDMMNDISNLETGINAVKKYRAETGRPLVIEGAISYISEPEGPRAWTLDDYGNYAVELAKRGCGEIAIKNYAGVGDDEMPSLIQTIREKLSEAGFGDKKINLHTHGQKPDILAAALNAGADKVDVAFGDLSGGPSHSNAMDTLKLLMKQKGFDVDGEYRQPFDDSAIVQQIRKTEDVIAQRAQAYKPNRPPALPQEDIERYRMAGGALSDLWSNYIKDENALAAKRRMWMELRKKSKLNEFIAVPDNKEQWFAATLEEGAKLWEKAGRFNTVTPGALILCKQAAAIMDRKFNGQAVRMSDYTNEYLDIVTGRYGKNMGMEKGIGDLKFRDAVLMYRALKKLESFLEEGKVKVSSIPLFMREIALGDKNNRPVKGINDKVINFSSDALEDVLRNSDIGKFRAACKSDLLSADAADALLRELTPGKSPNPTKGLADCGKSISATGIDFEDFCNNGHRISPCEDLKLLSMMLPTEAFQAMIRSIGNGHTHNGNGAHAEAARAPKEPAHRRA